MSDNRSFGDSPTPGISRWWWAAGIGLMLAAVLAWWLIFQSTAWRTVERERTNEEPDGIMAREVEPAPATRPVVVD